MGMEVAERGGQDAATAEVAPAAVSGGMGAKRGFPWARLRIAGVREGRAGAAWEVVGRVGACCGERGWAWCSANSTMRASRLRRMNCRNRATNSASTPWRADSSAMMARSSVREGGMAPCVCMNRYILDLESYCKAKMS